MEAFAMDWSLVQRSPTECQNKIKNPQNGVQLGTTGNEIQADVELSKEHEVLTIYSGIVEGILLTDLHNESYV
jgi:hypothetical protein